MALEKLSTGGLSMELTRLIGLAETQREIYLNLKTQGLLRGRLSTAYQHHEKEVNLLIKYRKAHNSRYEDKA